MNDQPNELQKRIGQRVSQARRDADLTQSMLAGRVGMERTQLVRGETGERKIAITELAALASELDLPIDWFVNDPPAPVLSRRSDPAAPHSTTPELDRAIDLAARDVSFLLDHNLLTVSGNPPRRVPRSYEDAEELAAQLRGDLGLGDRPLNDLAEVTEQLGVVSWSLALGAAADGACVELPGPQGARVGVAVVNGSTESGRRRWTLGHELGHFLVGDAYASDHPHGSVEQLINAFVAHLLMPRSGVERLWRELSHQGSRRVALALGARYATSWSAACNQLSNLGRIAGPVRDELVEQPPTRGDYLAAGESWQEELAPPAVSPRYSQEVLAAYADGHLAGRRTLELLRRTLSADDLPSRTDEDHHQRVPLPTP